MGLKGNDSTSNCLCLQDVNVILPTLYKKLRFSNKLVCAALIVNFIIYRSTELYKFICDLCAGNRRIMPIAKSVSLVVILYSIFHCNVFTSSFLSHSVNIWIHLPNTIHTKEIVLYESYSWRLLSRSIQLASLPYKKLII